MGDRKDLAMRKQRGFSIEFKRQVVEELLSGETGPAQLCRRYNISSSVLYHINCLQYNYICNTMDTLTPARILEIANAAAKSKGYAEYADFADDLFLEIMAGRPPYEVGWRLNEPHNVLQANLWTVEGRPAKFFPPQR